MGSVYHHMATRPKDACPKPPCPHPRRATHGTTPTPPLAVVIAYSLEPLASRQQGSCSSLGQGAPARCPDRTTKIPVANNKLATLLPRAPRCRELIPAQRRHARPRASPSASPMRTAQHHERFQTNYTTAKVLTRWRANTRVHALFTVAHFSFSLNTALTMRACRQVLHARGNWGHW